MNCPAYTLAWLLAQGRTCAVYGWHIVLNTCSAWPQEIPHFSRRFHKGSTSDKGKFGYININYPKESSLLSMADFSCYCLHLCI